MITTEERREIAARIDESHFEDVTSYFDSIELLGKFFDIDWHDTFMGDIRAVVAKVRELCDAPEPLSGTDGEGDLAATISAHVKRAAREGDAETAVDAISRAVDEELWRQREQARDDCEGGKSIPVPLGRDGEPVMPGDTVYGEDGVAWRVLGLSTGRHPVCAVRDVVDKEAGDYRALRPDWLTHSESDMAALLADELEDLAEEFCLGRPSDAAVGKLSSVARRLRRLGERS